MALLARFPFAVAVVAVALAVSAGVFAFARPGYHPHRGVTIKLAAKQPANDASGAAGWVWPGGTPGWEPGYTVKGYNVSGVQPVEVQAAQLAAARNGLDSNGVRVLVSTRADRNGVLAILAAPTLYETPAKTCLAAVLARDTPVTWDCELGGQHVLVAAERLRWNALYLVGVARGDVRRVVLAAPGQAPMQLYSRGTTWGQFDAAVTGARGAALKVYGRRGLVETLPLSLRAGRQRVLR
ncbi:MAG TPA: hypothetical protein VIW19_02225 [Gaiellaceae bacterium]